MNCCDFGSRFECLLDLSEGVLPFSSFWADKALPVSSPELKVRKVAFPEYSRVEMAAKRWAADAWKLRLEGGAEAFENSLGINQAIANCLRDARSQDKTAQVYVCENVKNGSLEGIMIASTDLCPEQKSLFFNKWCIQVLLLSSNPKNFNSSTKADAPKVRGAGSSLLFFAEKNAKKRRLGGVFLTSLNGTQDFYLKRGYVPCGEYLYKSDVLHNPPNTN